MYFYHAYDFLPCRIVETTLNDGNLRDVNAMAGFQKNTLIESGEAGQWDEIIREIGNIVYHDGSREYYFFYSGHNGPYLQNNVFVGMAFSEDGERWTKHGSVMDVPSEDPYVVIHNGTFYMFYEDKSEVPFRKIDMATSMDGKTWTVVKRGVVAPTGSGWQSTDVSSPVVFKSRYGFVMLYEGRGKGNRGKIGIAESENLLNWKMRDEAVFDGDARWTQAVVPDDVMETDDGIILTYHGNLRDSVWASGLAVSKDRFTWTPMSDRPVHAANTVMMTHIHQHYRFVAETPKGVFFLIPAKSIWRDANIE